MSFIYNSTREKFRVLKGDVEKCKGDGYFFIFLASKFDDKKFENIFSFYLTRESEVLYFVAYSARNEFDEKMYK